MRVILFFLGFVVAGCMDGVGAIGTSRPEVQRDVEGYAIASCLANQKQPYLKDQGDAWASVIIQRMKGDLDPLFGIAEQVNLENAKGEMAVIRVEVGPKKDMDLPILYCAEIIDRPAVRAEIQKVISTLRPSYGQRVGGSNE